MSTVSELKMDSAEESGLQEGGAAEPLGSAAIPQGIDGGAPDPGAPMPIDPGPGGSG